MDLTEFGALRRWAIDHNQIAIPYQAKIQIKGDVDDFGHTRIVSNIDMPLLAPLSVAPDELERLIKRSTSFDLAFVEAELCDQDLCALHTDGSAYLDQLTPIPAPRRAFLGIERLLVGTPETIDLFAALARPNRAGKAYGTPQAEMKQPVPLTEPVQHDKADFRSASGGKCIHGLSLEQCETCSAKKRRRQKRKPAKVRTRTVDVFDLLLPYLQPPLQELLNSPLLFPPGRRPHDYQITGIHFLAERHGALLGDEMGLGKTIETIVALQILFRRGDARRVLILCPRSLLGNWEREVKKWAPELIVTRVRGTIEERKFLWFTPGAVFLTTYETLRQDIDRMPGITIRFDVVILDEAQRIKNPTAGLSQAVRKMRATYRWGLSGTPLENREEDVVAIYKYLVPDLFGRDMVPSGQQIKRMIDPYFLRRRTADVAGLPDKISNEHWLELTDNQAATYNAVYESGKRRMAAPDATRMHGFALLNELKKICNMDPNTGESCKTDFLLEQLKEVVDSGQKALVFSHFPNVTLAQIQPVLQRFDTEIFDGSLSDSRRDAIIHRFEHAERPRVLLLSVQAGGVGLNLTRANHVFHFDHWWNPAVARQAEARTHRIGQEKTVFVHSLYTVGTIEERLHKILQDKQALFDNIIDDLSQDYVARTITDEELFGLFDLKPPTKADAGEVSKAANAAPKRTRLDDLSPVEFERLITRLYERMGFVAEVTQQSHDHGIDVVARRNSNIGVQQIIIQCKHTPQGTVGEPAIRNLVGAWREYRSANEAIIITSGTFSRQAIEFADKHRIRLIDGLNLRELLCQHFPELSPQKKAEK
ncbi:MAG: restriction endonuclease [Caldilineaceae bacterium]|nr:restriction endonuclease [Caldilineaceae bacterium]